MSQETRQWLNENVLIGFTDKRGYAWHYDEDAQGTESNHYPGAIPIEDVTRRLFNWEPVLIPATYEFNGEQRTSDFIFAVDDSTGEVKGCHREGYVDHSYNEWLLKYVADLLDAELAIGSAALLKEKAVAFVSVEVPDNITTPEGVVFRPNLVAATSLNGSIATTYKRTVTNVVCDNTLSAGLREQGQEFKVKHTKNSLTRLTDAREALAIVHTIADDFSAEVTKLTSTEVSEGDWAKFLDEIAPIPEPDMARRDKSDEMIVLNKRGITSAENKRAELTAMYHSDARVSDWTGTAFGVLQAVNTYEHHASIVRGQPRSQKNMMNMVTGKFDDLDANTISSLNKVLAASA